MCMITVVLEVTQNLGELGRPCFELAMVANREAYKFRRHNRRQRLREIRNYIHATVWQYCIEKTFSYFLNMWVQGLDSARSKRLCCKCTQSGMSRWIHEQHL